MSKIQGYISDAVKQTAKEITTKGVEIGKLEVDASVHVHNDDLAGVLQTLAEAQKEIARAVGQIASRSIEVQRGDVVKITGVPGTPAEYRVDTE